MKLAWVTDIHVDFLDLLLTQRFYDAITSGGAEGVLVGGDIAHAESFDRVLMGMERATALPIWFVLGNHDFYGGRIADVRKRAVALAGEGRIVWLGASAVVELSKDTGLVGHDGWGDARLGDHSRSPVRLNDFRLIEDLVGADKAALGRLLARQGDEAAAHIRRVLPAALARFEHVLVLTHVPPFREACWHEGAISDDDWLPYFTCKAMGDVLLEEAGKYPAKRVTVLCGHTHSAGECRPLPNLRVITGGARYGQPAVQQPLIEV